MVIDEAKGDLKSQFSRSGKTGLQMSFWDAIFANTDSKEGVFVLLAQVGLNFFVSFVIGMFSFTFGAFRLAGEFGSSFGERLLFVAFCGAAAFTLFMSLFMCCFSSVYFINRSKRRQQLRLSASRNSWGIKND